MMKISRNNMNIKCDMGGCPNVAEFTIEHSDNKRGHLHLCSNCIKNLYEELGKMLVPKSVRNKFNHSANAELKEIFEKGEK